MTAYRWVYALSPVGWLPRDRDHLLIQRLYLVCDLYLLPLHTKFSLQFNLLICISWSLLSWVPSALVPPVVTIIWPPSCYSKNHKLLISISITLSLELNFINLIPISLLHIFSFYLCQLIFSITTLTIHYSSLQAQSPPFPQILHTIDCWCQTHWISWTLDCSTVFLF